MYILAIETTGPHCSAALINKDKKIVSARSEDRLNHLKVLTPMIDHLLKENNITMDQIDAVAASQGPGSFTGIRIGVSTARAISQIKNIPCIPVPTLYAFAQGQIEIEENTMVCGVLDARRKQVYANACVGMTEVVCAAPYALEDFLDAVGTKAKETGVDNILFVGDGIKSYGQDILQYAEANGLKAEVKEVYQYAESVAKIALEKYNNGETVGYNDFEPDYMRKAEAQRKLEERLASEK